MVVGQMKETYGHIVLFGHVERKFEFSIFPKALVRCYRQRKFAQYIWITKIHFACTRQILFHFLCFLHQQSIPYRCPFDAFILYSRWIFFQFPRQSYHFDTILRSHLVHPHTHSPHTDTSEMSLQFVFTGNANCVVSTLYVYGLMFASIDFAMYSHSRFLLIGSERML